MFQVGQRVVCLEDFSGCGFGVERVPVKGGVYTIREFHIGPVLDALGLRFEEIVNEPMSYRDGRAEAAFDSRHFRPLIDRKSSTSTGFEILDDIRKRESFDDKAPVKKVGTDA